MISFNLHPSNITELKTISNVMTNAIKLSHSIFLFVCFI
jgi:hypothetical protein